MRFLFVVLLVLISSISFASAPAHFLDWFPYILGAVVMMVIILIALVYMLSQSLNSSQLGVWAKAELRELLVGVIIFVAVLSIFYGTTPVVQILTGSPSYQADAHTFIDAMVAKASNAYENLIKADYLVTLKSGFSSSITAGALYIAFNYSGAPYPGYGALSIFLTQAATALTNMILLYKSLEILLDFFISSSPNLLYFAFVLRFIPFTRQIGSTLIALLIGAFILFPLSLAFLAGFHNMNYPVVDSSTKINVPTPQISDAQFSSMEFTLPPGSNFICTEGWIRALVANFGEVGFALPPCLIYAAAAALASFGAGFIPAFNACWAILAGIIYPIIMNIVLPASWAILTATSMLSSSSTVSTSFVILQGFLTDVNNLVVVSIVDVLFVAVFVVVGVRSISLALGGEYLLPGIQRLIQ